MNSTEKKSRSRNGAMRNTNIDWEHKQRLLIQRNTKWFITKKQKDAAEIWPEFIWVCLRPAKCPRNSIKYNCQKICNWMRKPETILEVSRKVTFVEIINHSMIHKFLIYFTNNRKNTSKMVDFTTHLSLTFSNTGIADETFQKSGK